jgi:hypothetical protein
MMRIDYPTTSTSFSPGHDEQTKSLRELVYSDRVVVGRASRPGRHERAIKYYSEDSSRYKYNDGGEKNESPDDEPIPIPSEDNNNKEPDEATPPSAMELRIQALQQVLTQLAEQHVNGNVANHNQAPSSVVAPLNHKPMIHSDVPSSSNITFYPRILPPPNLTQSTTVILAMSAQYNFAKRQAIRETWAQGHDNVYFIVGHSNCHTNMENPMDVQMRKDRRTQTTHSCQERDHAFLMQEQLRFRDLIEVPILELYRDIPEKVVQSYHFSITHLPQVRWLVKADDDMFVFVGRVETYLQKYNSYLPMLIGRLIMESPVNRDGKWAEQEYPYIYYPYWPQGSAGHIMSRPTVEYIVENSPKLHRYQGEDVSIGIWLDEAKQQQGGKLRNLQYIHVPHMMQTQGYKEHCQDDTLLIIGHDMKPQALEECMKWNNNEELPKVQAWLDDTADFDPPNRIKSQVDAYNGKAADQSNNAANYTGFRNIFGVSDQERRQRIRQALRGGQQGAINN